MRPEMELLLCCAHMRLEPERIRRLVSGSIDWDFTIEQACRHRLAPLLYWTLVRPDGPASCRDLLPDGIAEWLDQIFQTTCRRNLLLTEELYKALKALDAKGIAAITYKGPVLAARYYGHLGLRDFADLDILVHPRDAAQAASVLMASDYLPSLYRNRSGMQFAFQFARAFRQEVSYLSKDGSVEIDLHWALMPESFALCSVERQMWLRAKTVSVFGQNILGVSREDLLLIACMHGSKHRWERLSWVRDVAAVLASDGSSNEEIDWDVVEKRASEMRMRRALYLGLSLAGTLLGAALPHTVRWHLEGETAMWALGADIYATFCSGGGPATGSFAAGRFLARSREDWRDGLRCWVNLITRPTMAEWLALRLPRQLFPLYYLLRPVRLLAKHVAGYGETRQD